MNLISDLNWRYATKKMNGEMVSDEKLNLVLDAINLTATSYGLQPFKVTVVSNPDIKLQLQAAAYGQPQVGSCSHVLVFTVPLKITKDDIQKFIDLMVTERKVPAVVLDDYKNTILNTIGAQPADKQQEWSAKQAYIALGTALVAAAEQKIDACPMEGLDTAQFDKILGLTKKGYKSVVMMVLGYRASTDESAKYAKVRKAKNDMFEMVN